MSSKIVVPLSKQPIFLKVDQCQPHENFQMARHYFQVVNQVKTKPTLAGNQIPFGGTRLSFVQVSIVEGGYPLLQTPRQNQVLFLRREFVFQLTQAQFYPNLQLGSSGGLSKNFHVVGIGPLLKIMAVKYLQQKTKLLIVNY